MSAPLPFYESSPLDARLVTKTSFPRPKKAIALLILLWYVNDKAAIIEYGKTESNDGTLINDEIVNNVESYCLNHHIDITDINVVDILKDNPLLESQMEALNSAFELVWHLASFDFVDNSLSRGSERKGGIRYRKIIKYSSNLDLIDLVGSMNPGLFARVIMNWISDGAISGDTDIENYLVRMLSIFSGTSFFKSSKGEKGTIFTVSGIYDALLRDESTVNIVDPGEEIQGTTRILKSAVESGLYPFLSIKGNDISKVSEVSNNKLKSYSERAKTSMVLSNVKINVTKNGEIHGDNDVVSYINQPHNYIFFGAPGTGKSYQLNNLALGDNGAGALFAEANVRRVTFYPDYTYSQFVGCFKPYSEFVVPGDKSTSEMTSRIEYRFVAGPFLEAYMDACRNPNENYLLIIEEINRANPADVFGDIFQLLDRKINGESEYSVATPFEMRNYLEVILPAGASRQIDIDNMDSPYEKLKRKASHLSLPSNLYIWATMNSADQGVFPMDTAFKRRWDFNYIDINNGAHAIKDKIVTVAGIRIVWDKLRRKINSLMLDNKINEDKLLGPFFIAPDSLNDSRFVDVFKDKVLLYLYEDAGKMKRKGLFTNESATYSELCNQFDSEGVGIFKNIKPYDVIYSNTIEELED